jgi:hypothetical protein
MNLQPSPDHNKKFPEFFIKLRLSVTGNARPVKAMIRETSSLGKWGKFCYGVNSNSHNHQKILRRCASVTEIRRELLECQLNITMVKSPQPIILIGVERSAEIQQ